MKEPYGGGLATDSGPESCVAARKGRGEALTGVRAGWVWSLENVITPGADALVSGGRQDRTCRNREARIGPGGV